MMDRVLISPFVMYRMAGAPVGSMNGLLLQQTTLLLESAERLEEKMERLRPNLEEDLYQLIGILTEEELILSRAVLSLKRDLHNGRYPRVEAALLLEIQAKLSPQVAERLQLWLKVTEERGIALINATAIFEQEVNQAAEKLSFEMKDPEKQKGLVLASSEYIRSFREKPIKYWLPKHQYARSSMAYLSRIVAKTSPFSTLTLVGLTSFTEEALVQEKNPVKIYDCRISQAVPATIVFQLARDEAFAPLFTYEKNPSLRLEDGKVSYIKTQYVISNGFSWRQDRPVEKVLSESERELVAQLSSGSYKELLQKLGSFGTLHSCLEEGWLRPVLPYSRRERYPLRMVGQLVKNGSRCPRGRRISRTILWLDGAVQAMKSAPSSHRLKLQDGIWHRTEKVFQLLPSLPSEYFKRANLIYEDVSTGEPLFKLGEKVREDLAELAKLMRPYFFRSHVYDLLVEHFVHQYGPGGECRDVEAFLMSFERRKDRPRLLKKAINLDKQMAKKLDDERVGWKPSMSVSPPNATVFFQIAAKGGSSAVEVGDYNLIVNQVSPGLGGLFVRFLTLFGEENGRLSDQLRRWLEERHEEARVVDFPVIADFNSLQIDYSVADGVLRWSGENPTLETPEDLLLSNLTVIHEEGGNLTLRGPDGNILAPQYLGTVPHYLLQGPIAYFLTLLAPWINAFPAGWCISPLRGVLSPPEETEFYPRQQTGRLVLRRARWRVPLHKFPLKVAGESEFAYWLRLRAWQMNHSIPDEIFISGERSSLSLDPKKRKPMWLDFRSCHAIAAAIQNVVQEDLLTVTLTEALPCLSDHWLKDRNGEPRASEFVTLLQWPRT